MQTALKPALDAGGHRNWIAGKGGMLAFTLHFAA